MTSHRPPAHGQAARRVLTSLALLALSAGVFRAALVPADIPELEPRTQEILGMQSGVRTLDLSVDATGAALNVRSVPGGEPYSLRYEGVAADTLEGNASTADGAARASYHVRRRERDLLFVMGTGGPHRALDVDVREDLPLDLKLVGGRDRRIDLTDARLRSLVLRSDWSDADLRLPRTGRYEAELSSDTGDVRLTLPDGDARADLRVTTGWGDVDAALPGSATVRVTVRLRGPDAEDARADLADVDGEEAASVRLRPPRSVRLPDRYRLDTDRLTDTERVLTYVAAGAGGPTVALDVVSGGGDLTVQDR